MIFFVERTNPPTAFFCLPEEIKKKRLFCPKLHKNSRISLNNKGDIFLLRARINTHAEALLSFYCCRCSVFARSFFSSSSLSLRLFLLPPREKVKEAS
jgi:hypothetical protein